METTTEAGSRWTSVQVGVLAFICLALGAVTGYLLRSVNSAAPAAAPVAAAAAAERNPLPPPGPGAGQVTPEQLKHMADTKAAPLLASLPARPRDTALLTQVGDIYYETQQFQDARKYYEQAVAVKETPDSLTQLSNTYHYLGENDKAMAALNRALAIDPNWADALFNLGMLEWQVKARPDAAIALWEKLLQTNPNHPHRAQVEQMIERAREHKNLK
jgi:tetratricopeptide (TPR) repeat protein